MKEQLLPIQESNPKINEYVERIKAGADKNTTLQGLPQSWISAVEAKIGGTPEAAPQEELEAAPAVIPREEVPDPEIVTKQKEEKLTKEQEQIDSLREQLGVIQKTVKFEGLENMGPVLEKIGETHYLFTHQTEEGVAQDIFNSQFHVSPGTGISSTMTWLGPEMVLNQIQRQMGGDAHRGYKGMVIAAVPKELLDQQGGRNKADALGDYLLESPLYGKDGNSDIVIPKEYNFGYLQGSTLKVSSNFAENIQSEPPSVTEQVEQESGIEEKIKQTMGDHVRLETEMNTFLDGMQMRFRESEDATFAPRYQNALAEDFEKLKKATVIEEVSKGYEDIAKTIGEMEYLMEYGAMYTNDREGEIKDLETMEDALGGFIQELMKLTADLSVQLEKSNVKEVQFLNYTENVLKDKVQRFKNVLQDKKSRLVR